MLRFTKRPETVKRVAHAYVLQMAMSKLLQELSIHDMAESETLQAFLQSDRNKEQCENISDQDFERMLRNLEAYSYVAMKGHSELSEFIMKERASKHIEDVDSFLNYLLDLTELDHRHKERDKC